MPREVERWQRSVEDFGGRARQSSGITEALARSNLGGSVLLPVNQAQPTYPNKILAEVTLPRPVALDVALSVSNLIGANGVFSLDVGDAFARVTWGVSGGVVHEAEIDIGTGWIKTFVASFLRVEFVGREQSWVLGGAGRPAPGNQSDAVRIGASVGPSSAGRAGVALRRSRFYPDLPGSTETSLPVPPFAQAFRLTANEGAYNVDITALTGQATAVGRWLWNGNLGGSPSYGASVFWVELPQRAVRINILNNSGGALLQPTLAYKLAL